MSWMDDPHTTRLALLIIGLVSIALLSLILWRVVRVGRIAHETVARSNDGINELRELRRVGREAQVAMAAERFAQAELQRMLSLCRDAFVAVDENGLIIAWNSAAEHLFGYRVEEALGRRAEMLIPPGLREEQRRAFREYMNAQGRLGMPLHIETCGLDADGCELPIGATIWMTELPETVICNAFVYPRSGP